MIRGIGTIVNTLAVLVGGGIGLAVGRGLPDRMQKILTQACGLATVMIGISGALQQMLSVQQDRLTGDGTLLLIFSLVIGGMIGEALQLEQKLERLGEWMKDRLHQTPDSQFADGFVTATLIICVGAMAVMGSLQDGIAGDPSILYMKALLDCVIIAVLASDLGIGVLFSAIPLGLYQGAITCFAVMIEPFLTDAFISRLSMVGFVLILGIGINLLFGKRLKMGNFLPALLVPVIYQIVLGL
ncbi:MAG: DUF554 domain-containing protein [Clostridia bacterium]|nr:DUF554 domain-containing protein [Clostridia bacterium]